ncbi:hypothetical protein E4U55_004105 [Claviceps digitariae]|nr:hypothetical protein E4U55_004105 [Claviceps digitariae]
MLTTSLITALLLWGIGIARADFVQPPPYAKNSYQDNPRYTLGSGVEFSWRTETSSAMALDLMLFIDWPRVPEHPDRAESYYLEKNIPQDKTTYNWTATLMNRQSLVPPGRDAVCFLAMAYAGAMTIKYYSTYFNISVPETLRTATDSAMATQTFSAVSAPVAFPTGIVVPDTTYLMPSMAMPRVTGTSGGNGRGNGNGNDTAGEESEAAGGPLSGAAIAGISVGSGLGAVAVLAAVAVLWRRKGGQSRSQSQSHKQTPGMDVYPPSRHTTPMGQHASPVPSPSPYSIPYSQFVPRQQRRQTGATTQTAQTAHTAHTAHSAYTAYTAQSVRTAQSDLDSKFGAVAPSTQPGTSELDAGGREIYELP